MLGLPESVSSLVCQMFDGMSDQYQDFILEVIAYLFLNPCEKTESLAATRDDSNALSTAIFPPVLPENFGQMNFREFYQLIAEQ